MTSAARTFDDADDSALPVARIDAQEDNYVKPLREYLEANDCRVISGAFFARPVNYHIVAGDAQFVKEILSHLANDKIKTLGIVVDTAYPDGKNLVKDNRKIIVVDPVPLTPEDVVEIFYFFFAEKDHFSDKRRNRHDHNLTPMSPVYKKIESDASAGDTKRIGSLIKEVFDEEDARSNAKKRRHRRKKQKRLFFWSVALFNLLVIVPIMWYILSLSFAAGGFIFGGKNLRDGNLAGSERFVSFGSHWLSQSQIALTVIRVPMTVAGQSKAIRGQERLLSFLNESKMILRETHEIVDVGKKTTVALFDQESNRSSESVAVLLKRLQISVSSVQAEIGLARAQLSTLTQEKPFPFFISIVNQRAEELMSFMDRSRYMLASLDYMLSLYPRFAGFENRKTYLVLLQNSAELRPTGGFIGSIGKLIMEGGVMRDFSIQDVYVVDGQLKGHVDPPIPIREILGQEHWYLRDSNWDPDFEISGERAAWFYEKETEEVVDGVVAISTPFVTNLLKVTGPLTLSDYNEQISADNFLGKSIYYTQEEFFPGSTQKRDFLGTLTRTLLLQLTSDASLQPLALFRAIADGFASRDIQIMFRDEDDQAYVRHVGWSGNVFGRVACSGVDKEICIADPLVVNEANLSVSKVNAFVTHENSREVVIHENGEISERVTIVLENTAQDNKRGIGGPYTTYMRFFVPIDASVEDATLDGISIPARDGKSGPTHPVPYKERVMSPDHLQALGIALSVPPGKKSEVQVMYKRGYKLFASGPEGVMDILLAKQPGLSDVKQAVRVQYPSGWVVTNESSFADKGGSPMLSGHSSATILANEGSLEYNTILNADVVLRIRLAK